MAVKVSKVQFSCAWTIDNFSTLPSKVGNLLRSEGTCATGDLMGDWWIEYFPGGVYEMCEGYLSLYLHSSLDITIKTKFSIINNKGKSVNEVDRGSHHFIINEGYGTSKFIKRQTLLDQKDTLLPGDKLTILVQFTDDSTEDDSTKDDSTEDDSTEDGSIHPSDLAVSKVAADYGNLLKNSKFSDLTIVAGGVEFPVHRAILASRSSVFSAMLDSAMQESESRRIEIEDASNEAVAELLHYIYTGKCPRLGDLSHDLYYLAEKYLLQELKAMCEEAIQSDICVENVYNVLALAETFSSGVLKDTAMDYITDNMEEIIKTEEWKSFVKCNGTLLSEIYEYHLKKLSLIKIK